MMRTAAFCAFALSPLAVLPCAWAQSPELALREFASGQIKKGVRSIGFGGDGATWGNYALVYRDASTALIDYGVTSYTEGNDFTFTAVGVTSPPLWHGLAIYAIALSQHATGLNLALSSPGLGNAAKVRGSGTNEAVFTKVAMPLEHGFSVGVLLSYELSQFDATTISGNRSVHYETQWRPSGGFGLTYQPNGRVLMGVRAILNHDQEVRDDPVGRTQGLARSYEYRTGISVSPWKGALVDVGGTLLDRTNGLTGIEKVTPEPNLGFEQAFQGRRFVVRAGLDESTLGGGISWKFVPLNLDIAFLHNLGKARVSSVFGTDSNSVLATLTLDYAWLLRRAAPSPRSRAN